MQDLLPFVSLQCPEDDCCMYVETLALYFFVTMYGWRISNVHYTEAVIVYWLTNWTKTGTAI